MRCNSLQVGEDCVKGGVTIAWWGIPESWALPKVAGPCACQCVCQLSIAQSSYMKEH
jgi:hypothetical protein